MMRTLTPSLVSQSARTSPVRPAHLSRRGAPRPRAPPPPAPPAPLSPSTVRLAVPPFRASRAGRAAGFPPPWACLLVAPGGGSFFSFPPPPTAHPNSSTPPTL